MNLMLVMPGILLLAACEPSARSPVPPVPTTAAPSLPTEGEFVRFVPEALTLQSAHALDLDRDGDRDQLLVLAARGPKAESTPRGVMLLVRGDDGGLQIAARNDAAIPCATCGGTMGEPLAGIEPADGGFQLRFEGGSRELWSSVFRFRYDDRAATWVLAHVERRVLDRATGESRIEQADSAAFGRVTFERFDPSDETIAPLD